MTVNKQFMRRIASFIPLAFLSIGLFLSCTSKDQFMQGRVTDSVFSIDELTFKPMGDSFTLTYSAESNWTISAPSWVHVSPSSGRAGTYEITVMATINDSWAERSGEIEVDFHRIQVNQPCPYLRVSYEAMSDSTITVSNIPVTGPGVNEGTVTAVYAWNHSDQARRKVDGRTEARIIELACGSVPAGYSHWTLRLLEKEMKVILEEPISREAIRRTLKKTNFDLTKTITGASPR